MINLSDALRKDAIGNKAARHRVAIIGGRKAGKTTLCASLHQSLIKQAHGYSPNMIARFPDATGLNQLSALFAQKFSPPDISFRTDHSGPVRHINIGIDFTSGKWSLFKKPEHQLSGYYQIQIDDLRDDFDLYGQFATRPTANSFHQPGEQAAPDPLIEFEASLHAASSLIICQPAGQNLAPSEATGFIRLMSDIAIGRFGSFDTIVVAFTKYERLFTKYGVNAFSTATNPETILKTIANTIHQDDAFETGLRALNSHDSETPHLYALPVSSFGFLRHNGAPNYDRLTERPIHAITPITELPREENPLPDAKAKMNIAGFMIPAPAQKAASGNNPDSNTAATLHPSKHWLPFLTADPVLTAISGMPSQATLPLSEFLEALDNGLQAHQLRQTA